MREISSDMEAASAWLSCAIKNLSLVQDALYQDIFALERERIFLGTGHLMSCCDAMNTTVRELDRIRAEMDAAIEADHADRD